jgi:hypothetical protein
VSGASTEHDYESKKQQANDGDDLYTGKDKFGFSVD